MYGFIRKSGVIKFSHPLQLMLERLESLDLLYEMLQLDMANKLTLLTELQGCGPTALTRVREEIARLEQVEMA